MKTIASISAIGPRLCRSVAFADTTVAQRKNTHNTPAKPGANGSHAFSFAEVMFAVVILGIGFIMVAAIFPVAIQQTQATGEESSAAAIARDTSNDIASVPGTVVNPIFSSAAAANTPSSVQNMLVFPPTVKNYVLGTGGVNVVAPPAIVVPFVGTRWNLLKGNMILPSDPRYAYVPFYRRESGASSAQLIVISVSNRTRPIYTPTPDLTNDVTQTKYPSVTTTPANFAGAAASPHTQVLIDTVNVTNYFPQEGFYLTTLGPTLPLVLVPPPPPANRTYRLGRQLTGTAYGPGIFEIAAGDTLELTAGTKGWGTSGGIVDTALAASPASLNATTTLQATVAYAAIAADPNSIGGRVHIVLFPPGPTSTFVPFTTSATIPPNIAQGAFVIVADDFPYDATSAATMSSQTGYIQPDNIPSPVVATAPPFYVGALNGRIFRLGKALTTNDAGGAFPPGVFDLDPQYGMRPGSGSVMSPDTVPSPAILASPAAAAPLVKVYIVGMGRDYTNFPPGQTPIVGTIGGPGFVHYSNSAQDVGIFTTYFPVK